MLVCEMGKMTSIYLTDEEAVELKKFCEDNQCTQYSALKSAIKEIVSKSVRRDQQEIVPEKSIHGNQLAEAEKLTSTSEKKRPNRILQKLAVELKKRNRNRTLLKIAEHLKKAQI